MRRDEIDWGEGVVTYWSMDDVDLAGDLSHQAEAGELREDLAQIRYGSTRLIDVGWYPERSRNGRFRVLVVEAGDGSEIQPEDWGQPLFDARARDGAELIAVLREAVATASRGR